MGLSYWLSIIGVTLLAITWCIVITGPSNDINITMSKNTKECELEGVRRHYLRFYTSIVVMSLYLYMVSISLMVDGVYGFPLAFVFGWYTIYELVCIERVNRNMVSDTKVVHRKGIILDVLTLVLFTVFCYYILNPWWLTLSLLVSLAILSWVSIVRLRDINKYDNLDCTTKGYWVYLRGNLFN